MEFEHIGNYYGTKAKIEGQLVEIYFVEEILSRSIKYYTSFQIVSKRKMIDKVWMQNTGVIGLKGLRWALQAIMEFEEFIKHKHSIPIYLVVAWDDNRRRRIYERSLKPLGYNLTIQHKRKCLMKQLIT